MIACVGAGEMGPWQQRETIAALEHQGHEVRFPVIPILLPGSVPALGFLGQNTWADLRLGVDDPPALDVLAAAIRGKPLERKLRQQVPDPRAVRQRKRPSAGSGKAGSGSAGGASADSRRGRADSRQAS